MEKLIECALNNLLADRTDLFGEGSTLQCFKKDQDFQWKDGYQSSAVFGRIVYEKEEQVCTSDPLALKIAPQVRPDPDIHVFAFMNEIYFYSVVIPFFESFRALRLFPKYYSGLLRMNSPQYQAIIIFENLQASGYTGSAKKSFLDYAHLSLSLRKLGEWHAYSYKARKEAANRFNVIANCFTDVHLALVQTLDSIMSQVAMRGLRPLFDDPLYKGKLSNIQEILEDVCSYMTEVFSGDKKNPLAVLCHGDFLRNNLMFKLEGGKPTDLKFIDLASCRLASPVIDLALLLYMNTDQRMRDEHWDDLINEYYTALRDTFPEVNVPAKERILSEFRRKSFHAYLIAAYFLGNLIAGDYDVPSEEEVTPESYRNVDLQGIPKEVLINIFTNIGGTLTTDALINILKDMINRGFV